MSVENIVQRILSPFQDKKYQIKKLDDYNTWLNTAKAGGRFIYHVGLSPQESYVASRVAAQIYVDYTGGLVFPFSVRKAPHIFEFLVVRSSKKI
jgi:hypothetical protein